MWKEIDYILLSEAKRRMNAKETIWIKTDKKTEGKDRIVVVVVVVYHQYKGLLWVWVVLDHSFVVDLEEVTQD